MSRSQMGEIRFFSKCKSCRSNSVKENKAKNKEKYKGYQEKYKKENRGKILKYGLDHYYENREEILEKRRVYTKTYDYLFLAKKYDSRKRAKKSNAPGDHTERDLIEIYEKQEGKCAYCKVELNGKFSVDHIIPLSRGGSNDASNIAIACGPCNSSKRDYLLHEWKKRPHS